MLCILRKRRNNPQHVYRISYLHPIYRHQHRASYQWGITCIRWKRHDNSQHIFRILCLILMHHHLEALSYQQDRFYRHGKRRTHQQNVDFGVTFFCVFLCLFFFDFDLFFRYSIKFHSVVENEYKKKVVTKRREERFEKQQLPLIPIR